MRWIMAAVFAGLVCMGRADAQSEADITAVLAANDGYYSAVSTLDPVAMGKVWSHASYVDNVGPPHKEMQFGWQAIQDTFRDTTLANSARVSIKPIDPHVHIIGNVAWVVGHEAADTTLKIDNRRIIQTNFAISVFEKTDGEWLMVSHHGQRAPQ